MTDKPEQEPKPKPEDKPKDDSLEARRAKFEAELGVKPITAAELMKRLGL